MFTFLTMTYNQRDFIIEHLESVKYQIEKYAEGETFQILISDDGSTDDTIAIIHKWIEKNGHLFEAIDILETNENQGIVKNYLKAMNNIKGNRCKHLAPDDVYNYHNIFEINDKYDISTSYPIAICDDEINKRISDSFKYRADLAKGKNAEQMGEQLKSGVMIMYAPACCYSIKYFKDEKLREYISQFKYIEDISSWHYIFNMTDEPVRYKYVEIPYILYRADSGISNNDGHELRDKYVEDRDKIAREIFVDSNALAQNQIEFNKKRRAKINRDNHLKKLNKKDRRAKKVYVKELKLAQKHLEMIQRNAKEYMK